MTFYPQKYKYADYSRHLDSLIIWEYVVRLNISWADSEGGGSACVTVLSSSNAKIPLQI